MWKALPNKHVSKFIEKFKSLSNRKLPFWKSVKKICTNISWLILSFNLWRRSTRRSPIWNWQWMPVRVSALPNSWSPFPKCTKLTNQRASFFFKISVHLKILLNLLENLFAISYVIRPILTSWSRFSWFITSFRAKIFSKQHHACQINLALTKVLVLTFFQSLGTESWQWVVLFWKMSRDQCSNSRSWPWKMRCEEMGLC